MMRTVGTSSVFLSALFFPWPLTALLAVGMALFEPLVPLAVGLFADLLYWAPHATGLPYATLGGALLTAFSFLVRGRLKTSIIGR